MTVLEIVSTILLSLGGGAAIVAAFAQWLGKLWATRLIQNEKQKLDLDIESYRVKLRKSEFIFQKEFEAASEIVSLLQGYLPEYDSPMMDWHEVCDNLAYKLEKIEVDIKSFISRHGAILSDDVLSSLHHASAKSGEFKFKIKGPDVPESVNKAAEDVFNYLKDAEKKLIASVRGQVGT